MKKNCKNQKDEKNTKNTPSKPKENWAEKLSHEELNYLLINGIKISPCKFRIVFVVGFPPQKGSCNRKIWAKNCNIKEKDLLVVRELSDGVRIFIIREGEVETAVKSLSRDFIVGSRAEHVINVVKANKEEILTIIKELRNEWKGFVPADKALLYMKKKITNLNFTKADAFLYFKHTDNKST